VNGLAEDKLGRLSLTLDEFLQGDRRVFEFADAMRAALVITLGGGYVEPIERTMQAHANKFLEARTAHFQRVTLRNDSPE
jgi:acetoin utilization deacetylase AcuC-like enzyme